jgi:hypothetical protein
MFVSSRRSFRKTFSSLVQRQERLWYLSYWKGMSGLARRESLTQGPEKTAIKRGQFARRFGTQSLCEE